MIKLKKIYKKYGEVTALDDVSYSIQKGKITALLGPNGAGKTTSMKILTGFLESTSGTVEIDGEILTDKNKSRLQRKIGYLPENAPLYPELNVWECLDFAAKIHFIPDSEKPKRIYDTAKICGLSEKLFFDVSELSKGYKQRVGLAQAVIHDPDILILDEPTAGLDPNQILEIRDLIVSWKSRKTILLSTHIMQEVDAIADNVIVIDRGKVIKETEKSKLESYNKDTETAFVFEIEISGTKNDLNKAVKIVKEVKDVKKAEISHSRIFIHSANDCRAEIACKIIHAKLDLTELFMKKTSMEDVFKNLTKK